MLILIIVLLNMRFNTGKNEHHIILVNIGLICSVILQVEYDMFTFHCAAHTFELFLYKQNN